MISTFTLLSLVSMLRAPEIGTDTRSYYNMFLDIQNSNDIVEAFEVSNITAPIYVIWAYILGIVVNEPQIITIMNALVINIGMAAFIYRYSKNVMFSSYLFIGLTLYYESMNGARQFMAMIFLLHCFLYLKDNVRNIKGWGLFAIAVGIHSTAIFFIIAILGIILSNNTKSLYNIFNLSFLISLSGCFLFYQLVQLFIYFYPYYNMYVDGSHPASIVSELGGGRIILVYLSLFAVMVLYYFTYRKNNCAARKICWNEVPMAIFCVVIGIFFCKNILVNRLLWYFISFFIVIIPNIYENYNFRLKFLLYEITFIIYLFYCIIQLLENKSGIVPYELFF